MSTLLLRVLLALLVFAVGDEWQRVAAPFAPEFPRDHGAHEDCRTEWWYATGLVADEEDGARFGWQLTIFRRGVRPGPPSPGDPLLAPRQVYAAHFALADVTRVEFVRAERLRRAFPALAWSLEDDLDAGVEGWTLRRDIEDVLHVHAVDAASGAALDLELKPAKPVVMHGRAGVSVKGAEPGNATIYASWTRLEARGTLTRDGRARTVRGEAWFDHEWGSGQLGAGVVGWDWFGLRLSDGRELMIYRLRRDDGSIVPESSGTLIERDGTARHLALDEFALTPSGSFESPRSRARYPARWHLLVPRAGIDVDLDPLVADCELDARASTGNLYWEGPVKVTGSVQGEGYGELTGYAGAVARDL